MNDIKRIITVIVLALLISVSTIAVQADTVYVYDGYKYTKLENGTASLVGWNNSSEKLTVPEKIGSIYVSEIGDSAFYQDDFITSVDFVQASRMYTIGWYAFAESAVEGELIIPPHITYVGVSAFENCQSLESVTYSSNGGVVSAQCFKNCTALQTVVLTSYIQKIDRYAFAGCTELQSVIIPKTVKEISPTVFKDDENVILNVWYDSYAHQYAKDNNIPYKLLDEFKLGDVNMDGDVNINDVTLIQRDLAELEVIIELQELSSDANQDGTVDISDATALQMYIAEYDLPYPIGEVMTQ